MNFWDTSALVALILRESDFEGLETLLEADPRLCLWWGTSVEFASAISRLEREGKLSAEGATTLLHEFDQLARSSLEVPPVIKLKRLAQRLLRAHSLKASDALQLASALLVSKDHPYQIGFVCLDRQLGQAAAREGFRLLPQ